MNNKMTKAAIVLALACGFLGSIGFVPSAPGWIANNKPFVTLICHSLLVAFVIILALLSPPLASLIWGDKDK